MNVILVFDRMSRVVTLGPQRVLLLGVVGLFTVLGLIGSVVWGTYNITRAIGLDLPGIPVSKEQQKQIDQLAVRIGQIQAQMARLDGLTAQISKQEGIDAKDFLRDSDDDSMRDLSQTQPTALNDELSIREMRTLLVQLDHKVSLKIDQFSLMQSVLTERRLKAWVMPTGLPLSSGVTASRFGWRTDPFTHQQHFHEGIDFAGPVGQPVLAAAPGVVMRAERHPEYGNLIEIDHGKHITSRYAHNSALKVKVGDPVETGQEIALLGSTGRSTGPHIHFEIRYKGVAQNPLYFIQVPMLGERMIDLPASFD